MTPAQALDIVVEVLIGLGHTVGTRWPPWLGWPNPLPEFALYVDDEFAPLYRLEGRMTFGGHFDAREEALFLHASLKPV